MKRKMSLAVAIVVAGWVCAAAGAAGRQNYADGLVDREAALASAAEVTTFVYPNADEVQVDEYILARYDPNGAGEEWVDNYTKVMTEKGKRENQSLTFHYTLPYGTVGLVLLEIIKPDGTTISVDIDEQSKVMVDRSQMSSNIYNPNRKVLKVGVPGLEIGDVVHYVSRRDTVKPRMPGTWSDYQVFEYTCPIKHGIYEVQAPNDLALVNIALKDAVEGTISSSSSVRPDGKSYRWEIGNVPRIYKEPDMPAFYTVVQRLLVSTIKEWQDVSKWYWELSRPHLEATTDEMRQKVAELTEGVTDRQKKIEAVFRWVSQEVRYLGITIEKEAPGYEPHDVKLTFENRHGVCRDKAALLVAMLRLAGLEAYPVLIHAGPKKDEEVPQPYFNHAITCVADDDGSYVLMDSTDESTKELLPSYLNNCSYLVARPAGETLKTSPIVPAEENMMVVATQGRVDSEGDLTAETVLKFAGINDNAYRGYFARIKPEQRRRFFEGVVKRVVAGARLVDFELRPEKLLDTSQSLLVKLKFAAEDILVGQGETVMLPMLRMGSRVGMVNFIIRKTGLRKRRFPLETDFACGVRETLKLQLDASLGKAASLPEFTPIKDETIDWRFALTGEGHELTGEGEFLINVVEFSPQQYLRLKESLKEIEYNGRKMVILRRDAGAGAAADVEILDHVIEFDLADEHNWSERHQVKKKILTYKGKKDNAELHLDYNPVWEQVRIVKASVSNGDTVKQISAEEINVMDAGWAASAPRYPAGKTLVASLPGVEIGSVVVYEYDRVREDRPFFSVTAVFRRFDPIVRKTVRLVTPASLQLRIVQDDNGVAVADEQGSGAATIVSSERRDGERVVREWTVRDQKAIKRERHLPPLHSYNPMVRITAGNWDSYAQEVAAALHKASDGQAVAQGRAREITKGLATTAEKIVAVRDFVAKNIRRAGPGLNQLPLIAVTSADQTLSDGYGNTTDRAVLLYVMLKEVASMAGGEEVEPEYVLCSRGARIEPLQRFATDYPSLHLFSGVLVRVYDGDNWVYLNDTNQYTALGSTPSDRYLGLLVADGTVATIHALQEKRDYEEREYRILLSAGGDATIAVGRKTYGDTFGQRHKKFAEMPPEERNRYYQEVVAQIAQSATAEGELVTKYDAYPGREFFAVRVDRYAVRDGDFLYFKLCGSLYDLLGLRSDEHENPFYLGGDSRFRITTRIEWPREFGEVIVMPGEEEWTLPARGGTVRVSMTQPAERSDDPCSLRGMTFTHDVDLRPFIAGSQEYAELLEINRRLSRTAARTVLLGRGGD